MFNFRTGWVPNSPEEPYNNIHNIVVVTEIGEKGVHTCLELTNGLDVHTSTPEHILEMALDAAYSQCETWVLFDAIHEAEDNGVTVNGVYIPSDKCTEIHEAITDKSV